MFLSPSSRGVARLGERDGGALASWIAVGLDGRFGVGGGF